MGLFAQYNNKTVRVGDTVSVGYKLIEKEVVSGKAKREKKEELRERIQNFEGIVISIKGEKENKTFTVRKIGVQNIGIERIFLFNSPWIKDIQVIKHAKIKRAKLYYLRQRVGKDAEKLTEKIQKKGPQVKKQEKKTESLKEEKIKVSQKKTAKKTPSKNKK